MELAVLPKADSTESAASAVFLKMRALSASAPMPSRS